MKRNPLFLTVLSFITLIILQVFLILILVTFSDEKPEMKNWSIITTNIPLSIAILCALKLFVIKLDFQFGLPNLKVFIYIILLALCFILIYPLLTFLNFGFNISKNIIEYTTFNFPIDAGVLIYYLSIIFITPILEELFFRKIILTQLKKRYSAVWAILISSVLFSAYHMDYFQWQTSFIFGLLAGYLYSETKRIDIPILLHSLINLLVILTSNRVLPFDEYYYICALYLCVIIVGYLLVKKIIRNINTESK